MKRDKWSLCKWSKAPLNLHKPLSFPSMIRNSGGKRDRKKLYGEELYKRGWLIYHFFFLEFFSS
jgi:hypothetical protein